MKLDKDNMMNGYINVVLASDDNYAQHVAVVAVSILKNTKFADQLCFFVLSDHISVKKIKLIKKTVEKFNAKIEFIDIGNDKLENIYLSGHVSRAAYFRLMIADLVPKDIEKIIYLDVDLLVCEDIVGLWHVDIGTFPLGAVLDYGIIASSRMRKQKSMVIGLTDNYSYFNSGVLIINVREWRINNYGQKVLEFAQKEKLPHHDQDALNKIFMNKWYKIPLCWNVIPPVFYLFGKILFNSKLRDAAVCAKAMPAIIHYAGRYKPWEFERYSGFNDKYYMYLLDTEFAEVKMPQPSKNMQGKSIGRQIVRLKIADVWLKIFTKLMRSV